ncbi:MAG: methylamine utilization protein MauG [Alphaproteobacteria bacterium]|nr:MAG: methylamine utilization protein MauG [Alphaproteobacteria bacterium]
MRPQHVVFLCLFLLVAPPAPAPAETRPAGLPAPLQASDFIEFNPQWARIGQLLFFDPILSGNRNIACATCHHPEFGTSDGLSLGIGEGGLGLGPRRRPGEGRTRIRKRIPRNAPALWNLGAREVRFMFLDGRVSRSDIYGNGFDTPAQEWLPGGLQSLLAVQALFPLTAQFEMAGDPRENEVAGAAHDRIDKVWPILARRVRAIPEYARMFVAAFDDVQAAPDITIVHIANAIAAFEGLEFQSYDSPFDAWLAGDDTALDATQLRGLKLFYGKAGCAECHGGKLFTDHEFHALMLPQFGPGRTRPFDPVARDVGRMGASDRLEDAYRFRTPSLRNVALTAPYGHDGAYATLEGIIRHHLDPRGSLQAWTPQMAVLPDVPWLAATDFLSLDDRLEQARFTARLDITPRRLSDAEIADLVAFLKALTGTASVKGRLGRPERVPSGLKVER